MSPLSRRQFLSGATAAGLSLVAPGLASAAEPPEWAPDHITNVGDDTTELKKFEPYLDATYEDRQKMVGVYGWFADSKRYDTRAYYYWVKYPSQDSLADAIPLIGGLFSKDAHFGDHEPFIVYADPDTDEVQEVVYSGYHHYAVRLSADEATLIQDNADVPTHMSLKVATPHHHYIHQTDTSAGVPAHTIVGEDNFQSFLQAKSEWERKEIFKSSYLPAVHDPWIPKDRGYWWADGTLDKQFARIRLLLNWRDSGHDTTVKEES